MFFFGDPNDIAELYRRNSEETKGPVCPRRSIEEMSEKEVRIALTYARIAYKLAVADDASHEVVKILLDEYDALFVRLAGLSQKFQRLVKGNVCSPLGGYSAENIAKYKKLAGVAD